MEKIKKAIIVNAAIVLGLIVIDLLVNSIENTKPFPRFTFSGFFLVFLALVNFLIGTVRSDNGKNDGKYYVLIAGVLLLIGFSVCSVSS